MRVAGFVIALLVATPAHADAAFDFYTSGKYDEAMHAGAAENNATGFTTAARAALADATTRSAPCLACLKLAENYARRAIAADPKAPDGHTYLAVALGYEARIEGLVKARLRNYPGEAKRELDAALALEPKNPWALAALGGWNVEIVRTGGARMAYWLYDASIDQGLDAFDAAFKSAPSNLAIRFQYALSLSGLDAAGYHSQIVESFERVAKMAPASAYERLAKARAAELLALLKSGDLGAFKVRVRRYQGYP